MRKALLAFTTVAVATLLIVFTVNALRAQSREAVALAGQVTSSEEGAMEGVLVSAKRPGSTITVTVVTDQTGRYRFPATRLEVGQYALRTRAVGYDLDGPSSVAVTPGQTATADLHLKKTTDLAGQLTNAEWRMSIPGTDEQKKTMIDCAGCHSLLRIVSSRYTAAEFEAVIPRMAAYAQGSTPLQPERRLAEPRPRDPKALRAQAEYLASINLSTGAPWKYPLKTLPRPTGRATHVIVTEYDLPRVVTEPHDVVVDAQGLAWYTDFGTQILGSLDPKTGAVTEYQVPTLKPGSANGELDLEQDKSGNIWLGMMMQGGVAQFDPKTKSFKTFPLPADLQNNAAQIAMVTPPSPNDGLMWTNDVDHGTIHRLDPKTSRWETFGPLRDANGHEINTYGLYSDAANNAYVLDFSGNGNYIGRIDAKTGAISFIPTPTKNSRPRRGRFDSAGRLWFAEYGTDQVAMYDSKTGKVTEWPLPTKWTTPYDAVLDKNGDLWTGSMWTDRVQRLDPRSGSVVEYLLPRSTNIRRVFVDNTTSPVAFWTGDDQSAHIVKLELLP